MSAKRFLTIFAVFLFSASSFGQLANGKLQIHHIDIGQGDGGVLITPRGTVVLFDAGRDIAKQKNCSSEIDYLDQLGVEKIDYIFVSHYHDDHIGCIPQILEKFPLRDASFDRGSSPAKPTVSFKNYLASVGRHRKTATLGQVVNLDEGSGDEVALKVIALNGTFEGGHVNANDENDVSLAVLVSFGTFREEIGGDLSGEKTGMYVDVETGAETEAGPLDVYKVHHHCSSHSSNDNWLGTTKPTVAIISVGLKNRYHHPAADCVQRLHEADIAKIYWTEKGNGQEPKDDDIIGGDIVVQVPARAKTFTVSHNDGEEDTFQIKGEAADTPINPGESVVAPNEDPAAGSSSLFAWSKNSRYYYFADCAAASRISRANLITGHRPPADKLPSSCVTNRHQD